MIPIIISRIFEPLIGFILLFAVAALRSGVFGWDLIFMMSIFFLTMIVPPAALLFWAVKTKRITNWDISDRSQRVWALLVFGVFLFCDYFLMQYVGTPLMQQIFLFLLIIFFGFFIITLRFKISGHIMTATLVLLFLMSWYGWITAPFFLIIPLLGWSRIVLKRHAMGEIVGGVIYPLIVYSIAHFLQLV